MRNLSKIIIFVAIFLSFCTPKEDNKKALSREERVRNTWYRNLNGNEEQIDSIKKDIRFICHKFQNEIKSSNNLLLGIKKKGNGDIIRIENKWNSLKDLKEYLNESWREKDFIATIAVFNSKSQNVQDNKIQEMLVLEIEYEKFTGKWTAFFDLPLHDNFYDEDFELQYYERN